MKADTWMAYCLGAVIFLLAWWAFGFAFESEGHQYEHVNARVISDINGSR